MRNILAACLCLVAQGATAADLTPRQEQWVGIDEDTAALVTYVEAADGYHVLAIVEQRGDDGPIVTQMRAVLAPGQSTEIVVPHWTGELQSCMRIVRIGDTVRVETQGPDTR